MAKTLLDLESMADDSLDEFQEAPDFIQPPAGDYRLKTVGGKITKFEQDDGEEVQSLQVTIAVAETLELISSDEPPVPDGSLFTIRFQGTEDGVKMFKREMRKIAGASDSSGMSINSAFDMLAAGTVFYGRISYRNYKDKTGGIRSSLSLRVTADPDAEN